MPAEIVVQIRHADIGPPAQEVLAVAGLEGRHALVVERRQREGIAIAPLQGPIGGRHILRLRRLGLRLDRLVVQEALDVGDIQRRYARHHARHAARHRRKVAAAEAGIALHLPFQYAIQLAGLVTGQHRRQLGQGADDGAAHHVVGRVLARDSPPALVVHHGAVVEVGTESLHGPVVDIQIVRIGDRPAGAVEDVVQLGDIGDQRQSITAGIRHMRMLHKRAVRVEAVAGGDVLQHLADGVASGGDLGRRFAQDAAQDHHKGLVKTVGAGFHRGRQGAVEIGAQRGIRHVVVDGRDDGVDAVRGQQRGLAHHQAVQLLRRADLPVPPVVIAGAAGRIVIGHHPVDAVEHGGQHVRILVVR